MGATTANLKTEEALEQVIQGTKCILWYAEVEKREGKFAWKLTVRNPDAAQRLLPLTILPGQTYNAAWYFSKLPEDTSRINTTSEWAISTGKPGYTQEFRCKDADSNIRWLYEDVRITCVGPDHHVLYGVCTDITAKKQAEEELEVKNRLLEEAVSSERAALQSLKDAQARLVGAEKLAALGQLVAGVAHEVNNPLAFVMNNLAVIQRDQRSLRQLIELFREGESTLGTHQPQLMARIGELCQRLGIEETLSGMDSLYQRSFTGLKRICQIIHDLQDFACLDRSDLQEADLNSCITSALNLIQGKAAAKRVKLRIDRGSLPPVECFPAKINQAMMNLLLNAIEATPPEGEVTVRSSASGDDARIDVIDTGHGIDPAIRERIFDPFFTTKPIGQGTGLGLSITHGLVKDHGGRIEVDSTPRRGTRFTVWLPLRHTKE
jgi:signal transduction histidine kinase